MTTAINAISKDLFHKKLNKLYNNWVREYRSVMAGAENLDDQTKFIGEYLGYMALAGSHEQNLARISYFLDMQTPESEGKRMKIVFTFGSPDNILVYVDYLQDVDLDDIHSILGFEHMLVNQAQNQKWTKKSAAAFIKGVKDDFDFDVGEEEIVIDYAYKGKTLEVFVMTVSGEEPIL